MIPASWKESRLYRVLKSRLRPNQPPNLILRSRKFKIWRPIEGGFLAQLQVDPTGVIRLIGWYSGSEELDQASLPTLRIDGQVIPFLQMFRFTWPAMRRGWQMEPKRLGFSLDYLAPMRVLGSAEKIALTLNREELSFRDEFRFIEPHYRCLLDSHEVLHRPDVYASGPPNRIVHPEIAELAKRVEGPVLDYGCGAGALVRYLRQRGVEAYGLELDSAALRRDLFSEVASYITLYDGAFPLPFTDGFFESVMCCEVLEHIPDYRTAVTEMARLARQTVVITVPDASAIPIGFRHGTVPWHLLESTHVNFFTQQSLARLLQPWFERVEFGRMGQVPLNDTTFYMSLTAVCSKAKIC